jgi:hypothetical protein
LALAIVETVTESLSASERVVRIQL